MLAILQRRPADVASYGSIKELGHFPMSENPAKFRRCILPVLDEVRRKAT